MLGGYDAQSVMFGNWYAWLHSSIPGWTSGGNNPLVSPASYAYSPYDLCDDLAVVGHYDYRLVPSVFGGYMTASSGNIWAGDPGLTSNGVRVYYIKPNKIMYSSMQDGSPIFKTGKDLAGRAVATDAWTKGMNQPTTDPGDGFYAHKDGYNVLYGDWSARWYGDPKQQFIWWTPKCILNGALVVGTDVCSNLGGNRNTVTDCDNSPTVASPNFVMTGGSILRWHMFDTSAGIDVGVDGQ
jgi:hypothetical protein